MLCFIPQTCVSLPDHQLRSPRKTPPHHLPRLRNPSLPHNPRILQNQRFQHRLNKLLHPIHSQPRPKLQKIFGRNLNQTRKPQYH